MAIQCEHERQEKDKMDAGFGPIKLVAGNSNPKLAQDISEFLDVPLTRCDIHRFSDGEIALDVFESVRGADVYVIQSTGTPCNDNLMELLIIIDAMRRSSAARINAVIPYYGYARQDRRAKSHDPITAKLVANMITTAGADRVVCMDLHSNQIQGFFDIPLDHLTGVGLVINYFKSLHMEDVCVVAPDAGAVKRTRKFAKSLGRPFALIDKERPRPNETAVQNVIGDVVGKNCIMIDDMIDTAGTLCTGADALMALGAKSVHAGCTHGVLSGPAIDRISKSAITEVVTLDTLVVPKEKQIDKLTVLSTGDLFGRAIECIHYGMPLGKLFSLPQYN